MALRLSALFAGLVWFVAPLPAQTITPVGASSTLEVATWNVEWFGSDTNGPSDDGLQQAHVAAVIGQADIDLWALQEISDTGAFDDLLSALGDGYAGTLATNSGQQRIGFIYKTDVVHPRRTEHILEDFSFDFASRPPLKLEADVTISDTTVTVTFITVHMKCCGGTEDRERRQNAAQRLKNHIDFTNLNKEAVVVLGDFNDELNDTIAPGTDSPYLNFINDPGDYQFATMDLDQGNTPTWCGNTACSSGSTLDHILMTNELFTAYEEGSTDRFASLISAIGGYVNNTSDHLPVYARFRFPVDTATEPEASLPPAFSLDAVFPNPFSAHVTVRFTLHHPQRVRLRIYDLLGRPVRDLLDGVRTAGTHAVDFDGAGLPAGPYLIRLDGPGGTARHVVFRFR